MKRTSLLGSALLLPPTASVSGSLPPRGLTGRARHHWIVSGLVALSLGSASLFAAGDACVPPGVSVATDPAGDATPAGAASPQQDITEVLIAEPGQADGIPKLLTTIKVAALEPNALPTNGQWRVFFKVGTVTYFTTVFNDPNAGVLYEYGRIDPVTGSNSTIGAADGGSISGPDKTLSVLIATSKIGSPAPGTSLATIYGRTQTLAGAAGTGLLANHDTAPNAGANSTATYTLRTAANACPAPGGTPTPTPAPSGGAGGPRYHNFAAPPGMGNRAGEPTLGPGKLNLAAQPPSSGGPTMYIAGLETLRVSWTDCASPAGALWENKSFATTSVTSLDPILYTDFGAGRTSPSRTFVSQLGPKTSFLAFSDDNGQSYMQSQGSGINSGVDHQTVGGGPYRTNATPPSRPQNPLLYPNAIYYASQDVAVAQLGRSDDGGQTFGAAVPMYNLAECGGLHGHIKVAHDGTVYVPNKNCGGQQALIVSENNGVTFSVRKVPGSTRGNTDPSVGIDANGKLYFAFQDASNLAKVAVSNDRGLTWSTPVDIGAAFGLKNAIFPGAVGGSSGRGAVQFLATDEPGNYQQTGVFKGVWHIYAAHTFDGGATWSTVRVTPENDPVQRGSICTSGTTCGADRNLLDFNDMEIDHEGRLLIGYADGCIGCTSPTGADSRAAKATIARQSGGKRLLAQFDTQTALPGAPAISGGLNADGTAVTLTWSVPDSGDSPIIGYNVYRREGENGTYALLATVFEPTYTDSTFNPAGANFYRVTAFNSAGEGPFCGDFRPQVVIPPNPCKLPGVLVISDLNADRTDNDSGANTPPDPRVNVRHLHIAEPDFGAGVQKLVFTMQMAPSAFTTAPPSSQWYIVWQRLNPDKDFDRYYVAMISDAAGNVSYEYGKFGVPLVAGAEANPNANTPEKLGNADSGTYDPVNGVITITLSNNKAENATAGQRLQKVNVRTYLSRPQPGPKAQNNASDITADFDYVLYGNAFCFVNNPPIAALSADPQSGPAPLTVNFTAAQSSDPDGDSIVSYIFKFGDGSAAVEQSLPTVQHTYAEPGNYAAEVQVKDSRNQLSNNVGRAVIEVVDPNATPTPTATPTATPEPTASPSPTATVTPTVTPTPAPSATPTPTPGPSATPTPTPEPSATPTPTPAPSATPTPTPGPSATPTPTPDPSVTPTPTPEPSATPAPTPEPSVSPSPTASPSSKLLNISTRVRVQGGDNVLIGGFIITGSDPKRVLLRAIGPSLKVNGSAIAGRMDDPTIELFDQEGRSIAFNNNWKDSPDRGDIQSSGVAPEDDREAAIARVLSSGPYTAIVRGVNDSGGIALVEAYDRGGGNNAEMANISTRGFVETDDNVLIGGFIVGNEGSQGRGTRVLVRAIGPSLKSRLPQALDDPELELFDQNGAPVGFNDNWKDSERRAEIERSGVAPSNDAESAVLLDLTPAPYTAIVRGRDQAKGIGLVEVFNIK